MADDPPRSGGLPPGHDEDDPYEDVDLDTLPEWWRENVQTFRQHGMRPYRPPELEDGALLTAVLDRLETEYDVEISLSKRIDGDDGSWRVTIDGVVVTSVERVRDEMGRSVYSIGTDDLESLVQDARSGHHESR